MGAIHYEECIFHRSLKIFTGCRWWTEKRAKRSILNIDKNMQQFSTVVRNHISFNHRFFFAFSSDLVRKIAWKSMEGLTSWTTVSLNRSAHSGGLSPWRHKRGIRLPQVNALCGSASWIGPFRFHFLSRLHLSVSPFLSLSPLLFSSMSRSRLFHPLSFDRSLSVSLPLTGRRAKIQEKMWGEIGSLYISAVAGHSGDGSRFASAKVAEMFVSWSHSATHACCALPSLLSDRISFFSPPC